MNADTTRVVPVEEFYVMLSEELFHRPEYHEAIAHAGVPRTHTMVSWHAKQSNRDIFTGQQIFAILMYAYRTPDDLQSTGGES